MARLSNALFDLFVFVNRLYSNSAKSRAATKRELKFTFRVVESINFGL